MVADGVMFLDSAKVKAKAKAKADSDEPADRPAVGRYRRQSA